MEILRFFFTKMKDNIQKRERTGKNHMQWSFFKFIVYLPYLPYLGSSSLTTNGLSELQPYTNTYSPLGASYPPSKSPTPQPTPPPSNPGIAKTTKSSRHPISEYFLFYGFSVFCFSMRKYALEWRKMAILIIFHFDGLFIGKNYFRFVGVM